jgi:hypothetical protein
MITQSNAFRNGHTPANGFLPCPTDYEPAPTPKPELPGWRSAFPAHTHSLNWVDGDGISHSHTVRSDDIDEVLRQVRVVKAFIAAAKVRPEQKPAHAEPEQTDSAYDAPEPDDDNYCPTHGRTKLRPSKYGGFFCAARLHDGSFCKFSSGRKR